MYHISNYGVLPPPLQSNFWHFQDFQWFLPFWTKNFLGGGAHVLRCCVDSGQVTASDPGNHPSAASLGAELLKPWRIGARAYEMSPGWTKWDSVANNKVRTPSGTKGVIFCRHSDKWLQKHPKIEKNKGKKRYFFKCKPVRLWLTWFFSAASLILYLGIK